MMMKKLTLLLVLFAVAQSKAQVTYPVNGIRDERHLTYALINARIYLDATTVVDKGTLLFRDGKLLADPGTVQIPEGAVLIDMAGKTIYPSFIEPWSEYGMPEIKGQEGERGPQPMTNNQGAYSWNQALRPETDASRLFKYNPDQSTTLRTAGFGTVMTHYRDGIARGTAAIVALGNEKENKMVLKEKAGTCYSFNKGTSRQDYPTSEMGAIALLRQTWLDAEWYATGGRAKELNLALEAWNANNKLPKYFEADNRMQSLRAAAIGKEFGFVFTVKGSGDEYRRIESAKASGNTYLIPVNFPEAWDVSDPYDALNISLEELKHWELAPANAKLLYDAGVKFAFTGYGLKDPTAFLSAIRKTVTYGLPKEVALKACTQDAAEIIGIADLTGTLRKGLLANFIITSGDIFGSDPVILENWIIGERFILRTLPAKDIRGNYELTMENRGTLRLTIAGNPWNLKSWILEDSVKTAAEVYLDHGTVLLKFSLSKGTLKGRYTLTGYTKQGQNLSGTGTDSVSRQFSWEANFLNNNYTNEPDTLSRNIVTYGKAWHPSKAYGFDSLPKRETVLIKNVTVWTNETAGILKETDVLIRDGKIAKIGKNVDGGGAKIVDGTGKHLTPGIIDEHSHIAVSGDVNECSHAITAEVRIGDVINPDDINIYRQLSGGVTTAQLLHGSCNPVGGQSAIIKLRWGAEAEQMKFEGADGFIKFALGENVKQSNWGDRFMIRYPQSRMGVEQLYFDAFTRAVEYDTEWKSFGKGGEGKVRPRRDLQLETLAEIVNKKRFITCHSYQQGEINMLMHVADSFGFRVNTFTHILEGYKVADKMKAHGVGASSFSDWWAYKFEVIEAIPHNGPILHDVGVVTAFNSDDAEMARRLNQEAAKAVKYGGLSEEDALKFVTLNPAKLLHIDNRVGSIKEGKDADVVLWTDHPLSIYAKAVQTYIDGTLYFDADRDLKLRAVIETERARLINKMTGEKTKTPGDLLRRPAFQVNELKHCIDDEATGH
jgi:imidazolonepropionase-like amidohydrolase